MHDHDTLEAGQAAHHCERGHTRRTNQIDQVRTEVTELRRIIAKPRDKDNRHAGPNWQLAPRHVAKGHGKRNQRAGILKYSKSGSSKGTYDSRRMWKTVYPQQRPSRRLLQFPLESLQTGSMLVLAAASPTFSTMIASAWTLPLDSLLQLILMIPGRHLCW